MTLRYAAIRFARTRKVVVGWRKLFRRDMPKTEKWRRKARRRREGRG